MLDIVVAGGGPAGSVCACELARRGWHVLLIDHPRNTDSHAAVPEILSHQGVLVLKRLGLECALDGDASSVCPGILSYWDDDAPHYRERPSRILNRVAFDWNLREQAAAAGVEVRSPSRFRSNEPQLTARFFVDSTGRTSAQRAGRIYFDRLIAIAFRAAACAHGDSILGIAPSPSGWWYTANGAAVYLTDSDLVPRGKVELEYHVRREWKYAFGTEFSGEPVQRRDARTSCASSVWRGDRLSCGDAAFTVDPPSGSGLTRAIRSAARAAEVIDEHLSTGNTAGLSAFAVDLAREFAGAQTSGRRIYADCARRFIHCVFWQRRAALGTGQRVGGR
jgi:flavin-dependent dehydrogenase